MKPYSTSQFKVISLRETVAPELVDRLTDAAKVAAHWKSDVETNPMFNPDCECLIVFHLNCHRKVTGHHWVSMGIIDSCLSHAREVFRAAIVAGAHSIIMAHNHPSGDVIPSDGDIHVTKDLIRAGYILRMDLVDSVVIGTGTDKYCSLRELGYFS